jgi:hypothetical protein
MTLNLDLALEQLYRGELLSELTVKEICERLKETMIYQPNVQAVQAPVTIVGDIHGFEFFFSKSPETVFTFLVLCSTFRDASLGQVLSITHDKNNFRSLILLLFFARPESNFFFVFFSSRSQLYDLLEMFRVGGRPPHINYLFLGNYVDRGFQSVEAITLLACLKLRYPSRIHLLRGCHESRIITQVRP